MSIFSNRDAKPFKSGYPGTGEISPSKVETVIADNKRPSADKISAKDIEAEKAKRKK